MGNPDEANQILELLFIERRERVRYQWTKMSADIFDWRHAFGKVSRHAGFGRVVENCKKKSVKKFTLSCFTSTFFLLTRIARKQIELYLFYGSSISKQATE